MNLLTKSVFMPFRHLTDSQKNQIGLILNRVSIASGGCSASRLAAEVLPFIKSDFYDDRMPILR
jgi:hypothetical protein